jgi:hypothetical protein
LSVAHPAQETPQGVLERVGLPLPASQLTRTKIAFELFTHMQTASAARKTDFAGSRRRSLHQLGLPALAQINSACLASAQINSAIKAQKKSNVPGTKEIPNSMLKPV